MQNTVICVSKERYDELLHKEAMFDALKKIIGVTEKYTFAEMAGFLLEAKVKGDD